MSAGRGDISIAELRSLLLVKVERVKKHLQPDPHHVKLLTLSITLPLNCAWNKTRLQVRVSPQRK